jgi:hypothetical protein
MAFDSYHARTTEAAAIPGLMSDEMRSLVRTKIDTDFPLIGAHNLVEFVGGNYSCWFN